ISVAAQLILLDPTSFAYSEFTIQTGLTPSTPYFLIECFRRFEGDTNIFSAWCSDVTFTLASLGVTDPWSTSDHATWTSGGFGVTLSNANATVTMKASGDHSGIRANVSMPFSGKVYFALTMDAKVGTGSFKYGFATNAWGN